VTITNAKKFFFEINMANEEQKSGIAIEEINFYQKPLKKR
jgi:uncharacterized pyridoxal phosphate-containing UPF0001 family protein